MKAPDFRYLKPQTLDACVSLLAEHGDTAQVLAGGQSLMPMMNLRLAAPEQLIDIQALDDLRGIREQQDRITIGALETHEQIARSPIIRQHLPLMAEAAPHIAHVAIRARGTIGGSLALADPAAEWPACCLALGADIELVSTRGRRRVAASDYFLGLYTTARQPDELVVAIHIPSANADSVHIFREVSRRRGDFAIAGLAVVAQRRGDALHNVNLALFGVADRPVLATNAMAAIEGQPLAAASIEAARAALTTELSPPDDPAYPAAYKRSVAGTLLKRALSDLQADLLHA